MYVDEDNELLREDYMKVFKNLKKLYKEGKLVLN